MKPRVNLMKRVWRKLFPAKPKPPVRPGPAQKPRPSSSLEPLEGRIAPATLLNSTTVTFLDIDGDLVTVKFSKPLFDVTSAAGTVIANEIFEFEGGNGIDGNNSIPQQLKLIDLTKAGGTLPGNDAAGVSLTITAASAGGAASTVNIGKIDGTGIALDTVRVDGALQEIDCGNGGVAVGLKSLTVGSFSAPAGSAAVESRIVGELGKLIVRGDFSQAFLNVVNGPSVLGKITAAGAIGSIGIGGSLIGKADATTVEGANYANWGLIQAASGIGDVKIGTTLQQGIIGGIGAKSGAIVSNTSIGDVTISGGIVGGAGLQSGAITALGNIGAVKIGGDLRGGDGSGSGVINAGGEMGKISLHSIFAGKGASSGGLVSGSAMGKVTLSGDIDARLALAGSGSAGIIAGRLDNITVAGSVFGGAAAHSGFIESLGDVGKVRIGQDVIGGDGSTSGVILAGGKIGNLTVGNDLKGGAGANSGAIFSGTGAFLNGEMSNVKIGRALVGGDGQSSGAIVSTNGGVSSLTIGSTPAGSGMFGGAGSFSGAVFADGAIGSLKVTGSVTGGAGTDSASIQSQGKIAKLHITGNLLGGGGDGSARVFAHDHSARDVAGEIGSIMIGGKVGGLAEDGGDFAAQIRADGKLGKAKIAQIAGGSGAMSGGLFTGMGVIGAGDTGALRIGAITGAGVEGAAALQIQGRIASLTVAGAVQHAEINATDGIGKLTAGSISDSVISARGQAVQGAATDVAFGKITVKGSVERSLILAGYDGLDAVNPDAQIGKVKVSGNWTASSLVAGVSASENGYGEAGGTAAPGANNSDIVSRIAAVKIKGAVSGTAPGEQHFGFVAQQIGSFKAGNTTALPLDKLANSQAFQLTSDVAVREIPVLI